MIYDSVEIIIVIVYYKASRDISKEILKIQKTFALYNKYNK